MQNKRSKVKQIPRVCTVLILVGFFLPWFKLDLGPLEDLMKGFAAMAEQIDGKSGDSKEAEDKFKMPSFSGLTLAVGMKEKPGGGGPGGGGGFADGYPVLFALPVIGVVAAGVNNKKGYITAAILGSVLFGLVQPAGQGAAMLKKEIGWFITIAGLAGTLLTALMLPASNIEETIEETTEPEPEDSSS